MKTHAERRVYEDAISRVPQWKVSHTLSVFSEMQKENNFCLICAL